MTAQAVPCPRCGASVSGDDDDRFASCDYCGSQLHLAGEGEIAHQLLAPALSPADAAARLRDWLASRETLGAPRVTGSHRVFLPFWVLPGGTPRPIPAAEPLAGRAPELPLPAGDLRPFGTEALGGAPAEPASVPLQSLVRDAATPAGTRLLHLPFDRIEYTVFGHEHEALVDAASGTVVPLSFPPTAGEWWRDLVHAAVMLAVFVAAFQGFRDLDSFRSLAAPRAFYLLVAGPIAFAALWASSRLAAR